MPSITNAQLDWNEAGTPVSDQFDDVYFSNVNGLEETRYVFIEQNHLPSRWQSYEQRRFVVAETGFGTGLNFLATWQAFEQFRQQHPESALKELHFISFEKFPVKLDDLVKAHQAWPELAKYAEQLQAHYPIAVPECHRIVLADGAITLDLWFGDIKDCMPLVPTSDQGVVDAWFLDGFAPSKNPEMWNQQLFDGMANLAKSEATCATFTAAGFVRRGLIESGFAMKKVKGFGTKREMLAGQFPTRTQKGNSKPWYHYQGSAHLAGSGGQALDIAIIGGGIASATLAQSLTRRGAKVTLYCKDNQPAQGASGNRQGAVYPLLNGQHDAVSRIFAPSFLYARQFVNQMAEQFEFDHDWCGVTQLMWDEASTTKLSKMAAGPFDDALVQALDAAHTNQTLGLDVNMASVHYPLGGWLSPAQMTSGILTQLAQHAMFNAHFDTEIKALERSEAGWRLTSGEQTFEHQIVIVANGAQFDQLNLTQSLPLGKVKGQVSHIPTNEQLTKLNTVLCYDGYMTPVNPANQHHCIGASYDRTHLDSEFDPQAQQDNREKLIRCLPEASWPLSVDVSDDKSRQGIRCVSRDHLPMVGNLSQLESVTQHYHNLQQLDEDSAPELSCYPDLYCMLGLGSRGLSSAPLLAEVLASQIHGDPLPLAVDLLEAIHPARMWVRKLRKGKAITQ
ncbi:bifunctional tRNA (5-methylaminomethyl-2-thiouridine)(34)-methyltransferase MnmD/FAD-dependent 5-carboxymethylaminomethyl-2-thiouridine(34) oxidoreductase MnmC [Vibrio sp. WXL103]|uniref:bifunctional tRNA (5-methylaminomethyl-2-thiouridine)(34)-methyltransferase MnmD/FAD-dependent 5-carboxymethylaminomethyl-2-thiouridine(34) oxidoreductase MnmC n=1 Tax=Vibrio sp. WXL103 TaxID=3450710 RepID=UPI003EC8A555